MEVHSFLLLGSILIMVIGANSVQGADCNCKEETSSDVARQIEDVLSVIVSDASLRDQLTSFMTELDKKDVISSGDEDSIYKVSCQVNSTEPSDKLTPTFNQNVHDLFKKKAAAKLKLISEQINKETSTGKNVDGCENKVAAPSGDILNQQGMKMEGLNTRPESETSTMVVSDILETMTPTLDPTSAPAEDPCSSQPCMNGGQCSTAENPYKWGYYCKCQYPSGGRLCQFVNPCKEKPCPKDGRCIRSTSTDRGRFCYTRDWSFIDM